MQEKITPLSSRIDILSDLWLNYRNDEEFSDFMNYNDLGLPLAYLLQANIVQGTDISANFINETFDLLLEALGIPDNEYENLDDMFIDAE